jgi:hypothetical protein
VALPNNIGSQNGGKAALNTFLGHMALLLSVGPTLAMVLERRP